VTKAPRKNHMHVTGEVTSSKGETLGFTGGVERDFYALMSHQRSISSIETQSIKISYTNAAGKKTRYTPEALIRFHDYVGRRPLLVEVKPREILRRDWSLFRERFQVATGYANDHGWKFWICTDAEIRTPYLATIRNLRVHRDHKFPEHELEEVADIVGGQTGITFRQLLGELDLRRPGARAQNLSRIYHLICTGIISADLFKPIVYETILGPADAWPEYPWSRRWLRSAQLPIRKPRRGW
jgi:hypothetical protein